MALSEVYTAPAEIISIMQNLMDPNDISSHTDTENSLLLEANKLRTILGSRFYKFFDNTLRPYCGLNFGRSNSNIQGVVMPLRVTNSNSKIKYSRCYHDVAAIQFDTQMEKLATRDMWDKAVDQLNKKSAEYLDSAFSGMRSNRRNKYKMIIFDDIDDLETKLNSITTDFTSLDRSADNIKNQDRNNRLLSQDHSSVTDTETWFRSLHLLVNDDSAIVGDLGQGTFFLNVLSSSPVKIDLCDYSCRIDCCVPEAVAGGSIVGNFVNFVNSFLIAINLDRGVPLEFGHHTRHTLIKDNLETTNRGYESKAFFCEEGADSDRELESVGPPITTFTSFGDRYHIPGPTDAPSSLYNWLHEYNLRVFNISMKTQITTPDPAWDPRYHFEAVYKTAIKFFLDLKSCSDTWKSYIDQKIQSCGGSPGGACNCGFHEIDMRGIITTGSRKPPAHINLRTIKKILDKVMDIENAGQNCKFDDIVEELSNTGKKSEVIQLEFYCSILEGEHPQLIIIHEGLVAPAGHKAGNPDYGFFFGSGPAHVKLDSLMELGIYSSLLGLCNNVISLETNADEKYDLSTSVWTDFSTMWELHRR